MVEMRLAEVAERALTAVEGQQWLDAPSYKLEHGMALVLNLLGGATEPVRNLLHGTWLGHPLHPVLTDVPVGAWTAALWLDAADFLFPQPEGFRSASQKCVAVGLVGAVGAAVTGLTDWQYTHDNARRSGLVHGSLNAVALGLYGRSWLDRRRRRHGRARLLSSLGYVVVQTTAYIGGDLVSRHRIGVDHADRGLEPRDYVAAMAEAELSEDQPVRVDVDGVRVVLVRTAGSVHALGEQCAHLGGPLSEGWIYRGSLVCPWHGSRYDLKTGRAVSGPSTAPQPCFQTRLRNGQVEVRRRPPVDTATPGSVVAREQRGTDAGD